MRYRFCDLLNCMKSMNITDVDIEGIKSLKNSDFVVLGRRLSDFAIAALDIIGAEECRDKNERIIDCIEILKNID